MAINKVSDSTKKLIREQSVLALPDKPSEKGYSAQQLKEYFTNLVLGDVSSLTELDRVVEELNRYIEGIEDTTIKNFVIDAVISKFVEQAPFVSLKFEDNKLKYTKFGSPTISGELDIIPENSVFFYNEHLKSKSNEIIYPKTTLENIIGGIGDETLKESILNIKTKLNEIESNHDKDIKTIEDSLNEIIGGDVNVALDSIKELAEALKNNPSAVDDILLEIANLKTNKVDVVAGKQLSTNDFDNSSKAFLDELKNKDVALKTDIKTDLSQLNQDSQHRLVSDDEKNNWNSKAAGIHRHEISDVNNLQKELSDKADKDHTHDLGSLGIEAAGTAVKVVAEHNTSTDSHQDIRQEISSISQKVDGINNALTFENMLQLGDWFSAIYVRPDGKTPNDLYIGQYIYLKDQDENDYWVSELPATMDNLSILVTDKIDLSDYAKSDDLKRVAFTGNYGDLNNTPNIPASLSDLNEDDNHRTITKQKLEQIDLNTTNIETKFDKSLGSEEANKMLITDSNGNVTTAMAGSMSILVDNLESESTTMAPTANQVRLLNNKKLEKQQGTENAGKFMKVNSNGIVEPVQENYLPLTAGSSYPVTGSLYVRNGTAEQFIYVGPKGQQGIRGATNGRLIFGAGGGESDTHNIIFRPNGTNTSTYEVTISNDSVYPSAGTYNLGTSSKQWNEVRGTTIYQNGKQVANKEDIPDTSNLATKNEIPDTSGFAKTSDLANYLKNNVNGTITGNSSDTPLYLKSTAASSFIGFKNSTGTTLGYFGVDANKQPIFYDTTNRILALKSDIPNLVTLTQAEYDALSTKDSNTYYFIKEE